MATVLVVLAELPLHRRRAPRISSMATTPTSTRGVGRINIFALAHRNRRSPQRALCLCVRVVAQV
jgi:hypothetical protein